MGDIRTNSTNLKSYRNQFPFRQSPVKILNPAQIPGFKIQVILKNLQRKAMIFDPPPPKEINFLLPLISRQTASSVNYHVLL